MPLSLFKSDSKQASYISFFIFLICGAISIPMLPVWEAGVRLLAGLVLVSLLSQSRIRNIILVLLVVLSGIALTGWFQSLIVHPYSHIIHSLTDVYGQAINFKADLSLVLYDAICLFVFAVILVRFFWYKERIVAIFVFALIVFWMSALINPALLIMSGEENDKLGDVLTGTSMWASWLYWSYLAIILVRDKSDIRKILSGAAVGVLIVGLIVAVQWLIGDFSYIIDSYDFKQYFYRVRGTYYYHTAVTFILIIGVGILLSLIEYKNKNHLWLLAGVLFLITLVALNNSRALSLSLLLGLIVIAVLALKKRYYLIALLSVIGCVVSSQNIFYLKPATIGLHEIKATNSQEKQIKSKLESLTSSNSSRSQLALQGKKIISEFFWKGAGVGALEVPLPGNSFNGIHSTYSTHILYLDILLMAGIFSIVSFILVFSLGLWQVLRYSFTIDSPGMMPVALSGILIMFLTGSLFLPQERNETIGMAFLFAALSVLIPVVNDTRSRKNHFTLQTMIFILLAISAFFWSVLSSPSYLFPAIEFAVRYAGKQDDKIYVNGSEMKPLLEFVLHLKGLNKVSVNILKDNTEQLPEEHSWILWNPKHDADYPLLSQVLGYQRVFRNGHEPRLVLPQSWWVVRSSQPVVSYIYAGSRAQIAVPLNEIARITSTNNIRVLNKLTYGKPFSYNILKKNVELEFKLRKKNIIPERLRITTKQGKETDIQFSEIDKKQEAYFIHTDDFLPRAVVNLDVFLYSYPNVSYKAKISMLSDKSSGDRVADKNFGSAEIFDYQTRDTIQFDFSKQDIPPIGIYRMVALNYRGNNNQTLYSWDVLASYDNIEWVKIESRKDIRLSQSSDIPSTFVLNNKKIFSYYKFRFFPVEDKQVSGGITELELYPIPVKNY